MLTKEKVVQRVLLISFIGLLLWFSFLIESKGDQLDDLISGKLLGRTAQEMDTSWITSNNQSEIIRRLHEKREWTALLILDDAATAQELANRALNGDQKAVAVFGYSGQETDMSYLVPVVANGPKQQFEDRNVMISIREMAGKSLYRIIARSPKFAPAVHDWAVHNEIAYEGDIYQNRDQKRKMVLEWWEHNKEAILAQRYGDATWLPPAPETPVVQELSVSSPPLATPVQKPLETKPILAQVRPTPDSDGGWELPIILSIIITTALAGGFRLYLYTSPKKI